MWFFTGHEGPDWEVKPDGQGPPMRAATGKKKPIKKDGRVLHQWEYRRLAFTLRAGQTGRGGELKKDGLTLMPSLVHDYWRWDPRTSHPVFVASHTSQRWRRGE